MALEQSLGDLAFLGLISLIRLISILMLLYISYGATLVALSLAPGIPLKIEEVGSDDNLEFILYYKLKTRKLAVPTVLIGGVAFLLVSIVTVLIVLGLVATMLGVS